jgi:predicted enzyme related to lactoylglutathione lyase
MAAAAVLYVMDLNLMRTFYERCFAMSTEDSDRDDFCVLVSDDWELSLVRVPEAVAATLAATDPPERRSNTPVKLIFDVASLEELRSVVTGTGGQIDPIEPIWKFRGHRHLDCLDPEGNVVQLRQRESEEQSHPR